MLDLNEVRMFVHVVRARSFAAAARGLGIPANTLSRRVRQLEATLGTRLMQRSTRRLTLTAAGQAFFERCAASVDGVMQAGKELLDGSQRPGGTVRIAAPADFLDLFEMDWIAEFLQRHPDVHLQFVLSDARADLIADGIDVAFRGGTPEDTRTVMFRQITSQHFQLVAGPQYLERRGMPQSLQELAGHDCLTVNSRGPVTWVLQGPRGTEEVKVTGRFSANSARGLTKSCAAGLGVALLPTMLMAAELRTGRLLRVLPEYRREGADFNVLLPSRQQIPSAVSAFVEFATHRLVSMTTTMERASVVRPRRRSK